MVAVVLKIEVVSGDVLIEVVIVCMWTVTVELGGILEEREEETSNVEAMVEDVVVDFSMAAAAVVVEAWSWAVD
jgi:hypothetical protein